MLRRSNTAALKLRPGAGVFAQYCRSSLHLHLHSMVTHEREFSPSNVTWWFTRQSRVQYQHRPATQLLQSSITLIAASIGVIFHWRSGSKSPLIEPKIGEYEVAPIIPAVFVDNSRAYTSNWYRVHSPPVRLAKRVLLWASLSNHCWSSHTAKFLSSFSTTSITLRLFLSFLYQLNCYHNNDSKLII